MPVGCFASCACRKEEGEGLDAAAGNGQGVCLWPLELTHQLFPLFSTTQGKLASFFLSRVDALSPQLQQVKEKEEDKKPGHELELLLSLILSISLLLLLGPCSRFPPY